MTKAKLAYILCALVWCLASGLYIFVKESWLHFFVPFIAYAFGAYYVYCWLFRLPMAAPYTGRDIKYTGKLEPMRVLYLILGVVLMGGFSCI